MQIYLFLNKNFVILITNDENIYICSMKNLSQCPLFESMSEDEIKKVIGQKLGVRTYLSGETILNQGDQYKYLLIILEGDVSNSMTHANGKNIFIEIIPSPGVLAPAIFYADDNIVPVNATAIGTTKVLPISKAEFTYMLQSSPKLLMNFLRMISNRSRFLSSKVRCLSFGTIKSRIAGYLLEVAQDNDSLQFEIIHTQQDLANMFGVTRPALSKTIKEMMIEGLISFKQKRYTILNRAELTRIFRNTY